MPKQMAEKSYLEVPGKAYYGANAKWIALSTLIGCSLGSIIGIRCTSSLNLKTITKIILSGITSVTLGIVFCGMKGLLDKSSIKLKPKYKKIDLLEEEVAAQYNEGILGELKDKLNKTIDAFIKNENGTILKDHLYWSVLLISTLTEIKMRYEINFPKAGELLKMAGIYINDPKTFIELCSSYLSIAHSMLNNRKDAESHDQSILYENNAHVE